MIKLTLKKNKKTKRPKIVAKEWKKCYICVPLLMHLKVGCLALCTCPTTHQLWQVKYIRRRGADPQAAGQAHRRSCSHLCQLPGRARSALLCSALECQRSSRCQWLLYGAEIAAKPVPLLWARDAPPFVIAANRATLDYLTWAFGPNLTQPKEEFSASDSGQYVHCCCGSLTCAVWTLWSLHLACSPVFVLCTGAIKRVDFQNKEVCDWLER